MAVITITITESSQQIVSGIPKSVTLATNIPASIFYTLDGTTPTMMSPLYVQPIALPTNNPGVTLKLFATNGVDISDVISEKYAPDITQLRYPHDTVIGLTSSSLVDRYPFGDQRPNTNVGYGSTGGLTVDAFDVPNIPDGYDGTGTGTRSNGTDLPKSSYDFVYSETNRRGERGHGIGTLPGKVSIFKPPVTPPSTSSSTSDKMFNPRAMVIHQDYRNPPTDPNISYLNREFFSLQNPERSREGHLFQNRGIDSNGVSGSLIRSHFNAQNNTITYYYRDSDTGRWIISVEAAGMNPKLSSLASMVFSSRSDGAGYVYKWIPFASRRLT
jgi:hypothetical protein